MDVITLNNLACQDDDEMCKITYSQINPIYQRQIRDEITQSISENGESTLKRIEREKLEKLKEWQIQKNV